MKLKKITRVLEDVNDFLIENYYNENNIMDISVFDEAVEILFDSEVDVKLVEKNFKYNRVKLENLDRVSLRVDY